MSIGFFFCVAFPRALIKSYNGRSNGIKEAWGKNRVIAINAFSGVRDTKHFFVLDIRILLPFCFFLSLSLSLSRIQLMKMSPNECVSLEVFVLDSTEQWISGPIFLLPFSLNVRSKTNWAELFQYSTSFSQTKRYNLCERHSMKWDTQWHSLYYTGSTACDAFFFFCFTTNSIECRHTFNLRIVVM